MAGILLISIILQAAAGDRHGNNAEQVQSREKWLAKIEKEARDLLLEQVESLVCPIVFSAADDRCYEISPFGIKLEHLIPLYAYFSGQILSAENIPEHRLLTLTDSDGLPALEQTVPEQKLPESIPDEEEVVATNMEETASASDNGFKKHSLENPIDLSAYKDYEALLREFYTIDSSTMADGELLNAEEFMRMDCHVDMTAPGPQILIYHTHSQERFADSEAGNSAESIVGVGEKLAELLRDEYGFEVLHYTTEFDKDGRDDAYSRALAEMENVLAENPSVQVVIDLHRDEMPEGKRLVTDIDGKPTAKFMFFNGLSQTRRTGEISYLYNKNRKANLAFSFQMKVKAEEYYPGLTRKNYLKGYRFNMHLAEKYLLIELGAQNNTLEEAMNACYPLAHILSLVLQEE